MKKQWPRIKLSWLWSPYFVLAIRFHFFSLIVWTFFMIAIHELGHILVAQLYKVPISKISIYPFGILADLEDIDDFPTKVEWMIAFAGPFFQIISFILFNILYQYQFLSLNQVNYLQMMNGQLFLFNLMPIYPLDGGRIVRSFFHRVLPYKKAQWMTLAVSVVMAIYLVLQSWISKPWLLIFIVLYVGYMYHQLQEIEFQRLRFYFHRLYQDVNYDTKVHRHNDLYRDKSNILVYKNSRIREKEWLKRLFHSV